MAQLVFDSEDILVLLSLNNENGFNTHPRGLICLSLPPSCSISFSMPTVAHLLVAIRPLVAIRRTLLALSCTPLAFSLLLSLFRMLLPSGFKTMPTVAPLHLFVDGRIADLVPADTINICTAAGNSLCIVERRYYVKELPVLALVITPRACSLEAQEGNVHHWLWGVLDGE